MTRTIGIAMIVISLVMPLTLAAQENDVQADVAISVTHNGTLWVGQQITLNLDVKTTGFSFSNTHFNLPEISGAFLMQTDTSTVKLTENVGGQSWQIVRYPIALYPQQAGTLEIPPIDVRFSTSAGFGSTEKAFEFRTRPLELTISQPPGVNDAGMVITTSAFELSHQWQPESATARSGDAFTLTVTRRARDITAMLLPPLPVYRTEGLAAYPQASEVNDITNRGDLTGERIDSIIWVVEKPGSYAIPGIRFQWWDPDKSELKEQIIPGLKLDVSPSVLDEAASTTDEKPGFKVGFFLWLIVFALTALTATLLWRRKSLQKGSSHDESEKSTFATLKKACINNQAAQAQSAMYQWLAWYTTLLSLNSRSMTLSAFSDACDDQQLTAEIEALQEAIISADSHWQGRDLLNSLKRVRRRLKKQGLIQSRSYLAPLN